MPDEPRPNFPVVGFVAGTLILTPDGFKSIEDIKPGDFIGMVVCRDTPEAPF